MRKLFIILQLLVIMLFSCTVGGVELGLVGTWDCTDAEGDYFDSAKDVDGTWVVTNNDTFTLDLSWKRGGNEFELSGEGTLTANYQNKIITLDFNDYEQKMNGTVQSTDPSDFEDPYSYILNGNNLTMDDDTSIFYFTKH